jgi:hypothetical protein
VIIGIDGKYGCGDPIQRPMKSMCSDYYVINLRHISETYSTAIVEVAASLRCTLVSVESKKETLCAIQHMYNYYCNDIIVSRNSISANQSHVPSVLTFHVLRNRCI